MTTCQKICSVPVWERFHLRRGENSTTHVIYKILQRVSCCLQENIWKASKEVSWQATLSFAYLVVNTSSIFSLYCILFLELWKQDLFCKTYNHIGNVSPSIRRPSIRSSPSIGIVNQDYVLKCRQSRFGSLSSR